MNPSTKGSSPFPGLAPAEMFAVDFATLAREIAQDIFTVDQIISLHRLSDDEWQKISAHPKFVAILSDMQREWNSAANTAERIKVKSQTGLESQLEVFIADINDSRIPLIQRVEAGRFLARLGELDGQGKNLDPGGKFQITLNIGTTEVKAEVTPQVIEHLP